MARASVRHVRDVRKLAAEALGRGGQLVGPGVVRWEIHGTCTNPRYTEIRGRSALAVTMNGKTIRGDLMEYPVMRLGHVVNWAEPPCTVELHTKCRKCPPCLKARSQEWTYRAQRELAAAARTWFGTMTLRPEEHWLASLRWETRKVGRSWAELSPGEQFQAEQEIVGMEITKWLKRVRKTSGAPLRYFLVAEAHKSGLPHYHILVHEISPLHQVGERQLRRQWKLGHSKFNLVEGAATARYVSKYLAKASEARVRASVRYGKIGL